MSEIYVTAVNTVSQSEVADARLGTRFGRMDLTSQLCLLAVEPFAARIAALPRDRVATVLAARTGSLPTDVLYWEGRNEVGGLSPTLFTYTLPSAAIGEIAIRHRLTGPNLCYAGSSDDVLSEATAFVQSDEASAAIGVFVHVVSTQLTKRIPLPEAARACAVFLERKGPGLTVGWENRSDMETLCANLRAHNLTK